MLIGDLFWLWEPDLSNAALFFLLYIMYLCDSLRERNELVLRSLRISEHIFY